MDRPCGSLDVSGIKKYYTHKAGFPLRWGLVFFILLVCCKEDKKEKAVWIDWINGQATTLTIDRRLLGQSSPSDIHIRLSDAARDILGEFFFNSKTIVFKPLLPFTNGLSYDIFVGNKKVSTISIDNPDKTIPTVKNVFPLEDTVPVNLLKIYLNFSKPMQEGVAVKNIKMIKNGSDTVNVFLDLEQELWNKENTMLTLWLDPGRIKRDLQPNILYGPPLEENNQYELVLAEPWSDKQGKLLKQQVIKRFYTSARDTVSPSPEKWRLQVPQAGTNEPVSIETAEILDQVLLENSITVWDKNQKQVKGVIRATEKPKGFMFIPDDAWDKGNYVIEIEKRLEDLAGNNLERLFDQAVDSSMKIPGKNYRKHFQIQ